MWTVLLAVVALASADKCNLNEKSNGKSPHKSDGSEVKASEAPKVTNWTQRKHIFKTKPENIIPPEIIKRMVHANEAVESTSSDSSQRLNCP